ncbi:hypothetical protein O6R08_06415 [Cutibacterium equinum]|uniref:Cellulose synthase n=1 Tax=Cutibacterium equinum TaxID=3016342 RepID=A0ABY7QVZ1_9ACTN|nr:hypothetical protein [Cutibacterium equinum]WCC79186.1 hypothetical protein O6R08_06415 [Cutibacterium equinum]
MSETTVVAVVTIVLVFLPLLWALSGWLSRRSSRALLRGLGLTLIPVGLVLTGLMRLLVRALRLVVNWFAATTMTTTIWIGVVVLAVGLVTWLVAGFMTPVDRETGRQRRKEHAARKQARPKNASRESASTGSGSPQNGSQQPWTNQTTGSGANTAKSSANAPAQGWPSTSSTPGSSSTASPNVSATEKDADAEVEDILRRRGLN